ncbi:DUF4365 domain-containing protein [Thiocystis violascens]|nr:DUF4365 domain-containing protein [Thiocystis violascens]
MLPIQSIEELISVSYVSAIIARSGFAPNAISSDFGIDLEVRHIANHGNKRIDLGTILELQLKASVNWQLEGDCVVYDMDVDAYNRLVFRRENSSRPCALVLCCLPKDETAWMHVCEDELKIKKCCYYFFINGVESSNASRKRLRIPRNQLLTPESLHQLKDELYMGEIS